MAKPFHYTTLAQRYTSKFPVITYVGIQVNFWILANLLLITIMRLYSHFIGAVYNLPVAGDFGTMVWIGVALGLLNGTGLGLTGYYLDRRYFKKLPLGKLLLFKSLISIALFSLVLLLLRLMVELLISPSLTISGLRFNTEAWDFIFYILLTYYFFMTLMITFINQVNRKYGPGVLLPLLLGRYRTPREEERIFMFMDLKSSTATAERLGHLKYSAFIRDCFEDINEVLFPFRAQVYQYVGDEIVVMWPPGEGLETSRCVKFYFAVQAEFQRRKNYYLDSYGLLPVFKAGMHMGKVTAVEIGEVKKDIAYHGDTLNTAARIQSLCNTLQCELLVSRYLIENLIDDQALKLSSLGSFELKGKAEKVELVSVGLAVRGE